MFEKILQALRNQAQDLIRAARTAQERKNRTSAYAENVLINRAKLLCVQLKHAEGSAEVEDLIRSALRTTGPTLRWENS